MAVQRPAERTDEQEQALTYDDLRCFPEDNQRREIIGGELIVSPSPDWWHQRLVLRIATLLEQFAEPRGLGTVNISPMDVRLFGYDSVQPDVLFVRSDRMAIVAADRRVTGSPDLVVEILSPTSGPIDRVRKFSLYANAAVPEYWIVDPRRREILVYRLAGDRYGLTPPDALGRSESLVLPGYVVDPAAIFSVLPPPEHD